MKDKRILFATLWLALPSLALATNSTSATASVVRPDGSAVTENFTTAGGSLAWFAAPLTAGCNFLAQRPVVQERDARLKRPGLGAACTRRRS